MKSKVSKLTSHLDEGGLGLRSDLVDALTNFASGSLWVSTE